MDPAAMVFEPDHPLGRLSDTDVAALISTLDERSVRVGDVLMTQGEPSDEAFLVLSGELEVTGGDAGAPGEPTRSGPGELVGLLSLIHGDAPLAGVRARADSRLARLTRASYTELAGARPAVAVALGLALGARLARDVRILTGQVAESFATRAAPTVAEDVADYDVVVIGAGYIGLSYACWVKKQRPGTRVAMVDKRDAPGFKIGESSLGPTIRNLVSLGIPMAVLRRLFHVKLELSAWWTGPDSDEVGIRISPGFFDESFQFERRVLETLMTKNARRMGVDVFEQTTARVGDSDIEGPRKELVCDGPDGVVRLRYKVLCDASGPASVVPRELGLYTKRLDGLNTNAYFGYFRKKSNPDVPGWDNASTRHLCFADGWVWFIELASWEKAPDANLSAMIDHLLEIDGPDEAYPSRLDLAREFDCPVEELYSIGVVPRSDTDDSPRRVDDRFQHYVDKYPGFKRIMESYELAEDIYPGHRNFRAFMKMSHDSERATGDGWLAVGDSAFFVNPLWSPGLAYGSGSSFVAAADTVAALDTGDFSREAFATYQAHAKAVFKEVFKENEMFYRSWADPVSYERVGMMKFAFSGYAALSTMLAMVPPGVPRPPADQPFPETRLPGDHVFGAVTFPLMIDTVADVVGIMRTGEASGADPAVTGQRVKELIDSKIEQVLGTEAMSLTAMSRRLPHYTDELDRDEDSQREPLLKIWRCSRCINGWNRLEHARCHVCGEPQPADVVLER